MEGFFQQPEKRTCYECAGAGTVPTELGWDLMHFLNRHKYVQLEDLGYLLAAMKYPDDFLPAEDDDEPFPFPDDDAG